MANSQKLWIWSWSQYFLQSKLFMQRLKFFCITIFTLISQCVNENWKIKFNFLARKFENPILKFDSKTKLQNWILNKKWNFLQVYNVLISLHLLTKMSHTSWLFNEGFYLHSRITTSIFDSDAPFLFFHSIGWGT